MAIYRGHRVSSRGSIGQVRTHTFDSTTAAAVRPLQPPRGWQAVARLVGPGPDDGLHVQWHKSDREEILRAELIGHEQCVVQLAHRPALIAAGGTMFIRIGRSRDDIRHGVVSRLSRS
jgi:hypothetical protein